MSNVRAHLVVRFYAVLPDDELQADATFDVMGDEIAAVLNSRSFAGIVTESFSIEGGDTELDE